MREITLPTPAEPLTMRAVLHIGRKTLHVTLFGSNSSEQSLINAGHISDYVTQKDLAGLVLDWRDCQMTHNPTQLRTVANAFAAGLRPKVRFAIVYRADQLAYAMVLSRGLVGGGLQARAFGNDAAALAWIAPDAAGQEQES